jgi:hypothetical protein
LPNSKRKHAILKCKVSRGTFTDEFFVVIQLPEGKTLTTVADKSQVVLGSKKLDSEEDSVDAGVKVSVLGRARDKLLIDLPRDAFSQGNRLFVPSEMVSFEVA